MAYFFREGSNVSYVGSGESGRDLGERGRILAINGRCGHVKWADHSITLEDLNDLGMVATAVEINTAPRDELDDSLEVGSMPVVGVRGLFDTEGSHGVLSALASVGQLSGFAVIAEEARAFVERQVREDPAFRSATAVFDPEESDELISVATSLLLRDAAGVSADGD